MALPDPAKVRGPGTLYVTSRISRGDILNEDTFFKWYDEDHIDEIVHTSGMKSALRYRDVDFEEKVKKKEKVFLAIYPMPDITFIMTEEFRCISVKSTIMPDTVLIYDLAEMDVRYLGLVQKTESRQTRSSPAPCVVIFGVEPGPESSDEDVEKWYKEEVSKFPGLSQYGR